VFAHPVVKKKRGDRKWSQIYKWRKCFFSWSY